MSAVFILHTFIIHQYFLKCKNLYEISGKILLEDKFIWDVRPNNNFLKDNDVNFFIINELSAKNRGNTIPWFFILKDSICIYSKIMFFSILRVVQHSVNINYKSTKILFTNKEKGRFIRKKAQYPCKKCG